MQSNDGDDAWSAANLEEQYIEAIERQQPNFEAQYINERENSIRSVFHNFQESATSIAQLYKGTILIYCFPFPNAAFFAGEFIFLLRWHFVCARFLNV